MFFFFEGLTNPPSSVLLSIYPISNENLYGTHTVSCTPPLYTGGLNDTQIKYKLAITIVNAVDDEESGSPDCTTQFHSKCNISCILNFIDDDDGYRVFQFQVVDSGGDLVSQLSTEKAIISTKECDVYSKFINITLINMY